MIINTLLKLKRVGMAPILHPKFERIPDDAVITPDFVATILQISASTVRRWCNSGKLPSYTFGGKYAIIGSDLKKFMSQSKVLNKAQRKVVK